MPSLVDIRLGFIVLDVIALICYELDKRLANLCRPFPGISVASRLSSDALHFALGWLRSAYMPVCRERAVLAIRPVRWPTMANKALCCFCRFSLNWNLFRLNLI